MHLFRKSEMQYCEEKKKNNKTNQKYKVVFNWNYQYILENIGLLFPFGIFV